MTIIEALEVVRDQMFGLGTRDHNFMTRVDAMKIIQPILEAAGAVDKETVSVVLGDVRTLLAREGRTAFGWAITDALALLSALPDRPEEKA
jgi:hypothetical protein